MLLLPSDALVAPNLTCLRVPDGNTSDKQCKLLPLRILAYHPVILRMESLVLMTAAASAPLCCSGVSGAIAITLASPSLQSGVQVTLVPPSLSPSSSPPVIASVSG